MEAFESFLRKFRTVHFDEGDMIYMQGEVPQTAYAIKKGVVKSYNITNEGEEKLITLHAKNELLPMPWVFSRSSTSLYYHEAFTPCEMFVVPKDYCVRFLHTHTGALRWIFDKFIRLQTGYMLRINALAQSRASAKLAYMLQVLCLQFGRNVRHDIVQIDLPLTQQDIANFIGMKRETTAIELKKLKDTGIIDYVSKSYVVKTNELNKLLNEECDVELLV